MHITVSDIIKSPPIKWVIPQMVCSHFWSRHVSQKAQESFFHELM